MVIRTDHRQVDWTPDPEGLDRVRGGAMRLVELELELGKDLARVQAKNAYAREGCASLEEFGRRCNLTGQRTLMLFRAAAGMQIDPRIEPAVRQGAISMDAAGVIGRVLFRLGDLDPDHDWYEMARGLRLTRLAGAASRRMAELDQAQVALCTVTFHVPEETVEKFGRARTLLSRRAGEVLTREEAFDLAMDHVLDGLAPERSARGTGTPRVDVDREAVPGRHVPAWVSRINLELFRDQCCVPGCEHKIFLQKAHRQPFAAGGRRGPQNIVPLCTRHHTLHDAGLLRVIEVTTDGRPVFETVGGEVLHPDRPVGERERPPPDE